MSYDVLIIGGGAAGLAASVCPGSYSLSSLHIAGSFIHSLTGSFPCFPHSIAQFTECLVNNPVDFVV